MSLYIICDSVSLNPKWSKTRYLAIGRGEITPFGIEWDLWMVERATKWSDKWINEYPTVLKSDKRSRIRFLSIVLDQYTTSHFPNLWNVGGLFLTESNKGDVGALGQTNGATAAIHAVACFAILPRMSPRHWVEGREGVTRSGARPSMEYFSNMNSITFRDPHSI